MIARVLNDQCKELSQFLCDADRLCNEAITTVREVLLYRDSLTQQHIVVCDENMRLKLQLQAVYIDARCLNSLLYQVHTEKRLLESALHDERTRNRELENKLTRERCSVDGLVTLFGNSSS